MANEKDELELNHPLPPESAPQTADIPASPITDIISTTTAEATKEELDLDTVKDSVENYTGEGFSERSQEKAELTEYLQRLGKDKGRYFGNIVHQGVRDHFGKSDHSSGLGEYANEIHNLVEDGALKSKMRRVQNDPAFLAEAKRKIAQIMETEGSTVEEAFERFAHAEFIAGRDDWQQLTDALGVHTSSNAILDTYYGTEDENESFVILPENLALVDRAYWSRGIDTDYSRDTIYNDAYLWPQKGEPSEIALDGGLIFVPRDNLVDAESGSRYEVQNGNAVLDIEKIETVLTKISEIETTDYREQSIQIEKIIKEIIGEKKAHRVTRELSHLDKLIPEKEAIENMSSPEELTEVKNYLMAILTIKNRYNGPMGMALEYFSKPEELKEGYRHIPKETLAANGFNTDILEQVFSDPNKKAAIEKFINRYFQKYKEIATSTDGAFYRTAKNVIPAKKHYEEIFLKKFKNPKIREIKVENQDIVEYRGQDESGNEKVLRVVFYTNPDPNQAVRTFYKDIGIQFNDRLIDDTSDEADKATRDTKRTTYEDVKYRYDYEQLRTNILNQF